MFALKRPTTNDRVSSPSPPARHTGGSASPRAMNPLWTRLAIHIPAPDASLQRKAALALGSPHDLAEREADAIAEAVVSSSPLAGLSAARAVTPSPSGAVAVQRKCDACADEEERIQRKASSTESASAGAPAAVQHVLRSGAGRPLDASARAFMEPRLGHDLGSVRIHTGESAHVSARAVQALAYTVGRDIVFAEGRYAPETREGKKLLAHELVHTVQQGHGAPMRVARQVDAGAPPPVEDAGTPDPAQEQIDCVRRLGGVAEMRPAGLPTCPEVLDYNARCGAETGYTGPNVDPGHACNPAQLNPIPAPTEVPEPANADPLDMSNQPVSAEDRTAIERSTGTGGAAGPRRPRGLRFVLHDTAAAVGAAKIAEMAQKNRGPLGQGVAAYVPAAGAATQTRVSFFEARRPTTSEYEKASDLINQTAREAAVRQVWAATSDVERDAAVTRATTGLNLTAAEQQSEAQAARRQLSAASGMVFTTAHWVAEEICGAVGAQGVAAVARSSATEGDLTTGCQTLAPYFAQRSARVSSETNVEIVQQTGSDCRTTGSLVALPPYTADQFNSVQRLYLLASLEAGRFPEITTHFWVDRQFRGHCDPRCFNVGHLYDLIRAPLGHPAGARYGATPNYGFTWGTHNVWWQDTVCGGAHP